MKSVSRTLALCVLLAAAGNAFGQDKVCKVEISGNDAMQYDKKELSVAADCAQVEVTLKHSGKLPAQAMGHNWVLAKTADTKIVGGGQSTSVTFPTSALKKGEAYTFFCTFPGHSAIMKGAFKFG